MSVKFALPAAVVLALAAPASAATITGTITAQVGGAAIAGAEVRVWTQGAKGWAIANVTTANGSGVYSFAVANNGSYLIDVRGPAGSINWGDRWYDVAAPSGSGYVGEDADVIAPGTGTATANVQLEVLGGASGVVFRPGNIVAPDMWVRMERRGDIRIHHNDLSKQPTGSTTMLGMVPATDYEMLAYDPTGARDTLLVPGPFSIVSNTIGSFGNLSMVDAPADPNEGNNAANCSAISIDANGLHMATPQPWSSSGARLSANDVDWYCYTAVDGDRLFLTATTEFTWNGNTRKHPWTDPMVSFWRGARVTKLVENDDMTAGSGDLDARVDTGPLTAGCYCAAVAAFGDSGYVGSGGMSTGAYQLRVVMGNRPPVPSIKKGSTEIPAAPATFSIDEGDTLSLNLSYADADGTVPTKSFTHVDRNNAAVTTGMLTLGASSGTYTWTAPASAALGSPYTLRLTAGDAEFNQTKTITLIVNTVDNPPPAPVLVSPIGGAVVASGAPTLTWMNATDPDGDPVTYDVELYDTDTEIPPVQTASVPEGAGGLSTWVPATLAENTRAIWRVRARDSRGGLSPWSAYGRFLVDASNDPPPQPILLKPGDHELLTMRRPGLSVLNVDDVEGDAVSFVFEIAPTMDFAMPAWTSPMVDQSTVSTTTMTSVATDLVWGAEYFARVKAIDARGGESMWSDPHEFRLKPNQPPTTPDFDGGCVAATYDTAPPTSVVVHNVLDPEGEQVTFELKMYAYDDDPMTANPVYATSARQDAMATTTSIPLDLSALPNGHYRYLVRALDGTDASPAIECELTLDLPTGGEPSGGCCDTRSTDAAGGVLLAFFTLGGLIAPRRRRG